MPVALITEIMESWPLGLRLCVEGEEVLVELTEGCQVTQSGRPVDPGDLRPGMRVRLAYAAEGVVDRLEVL